MPESPVRLRPRTDPETKDFESRSAFDGYRSVVRAANSCRSKTPDGTYLHPNAELLLCWSCFRLECSVRLRPRGHNNGPTALPAQSTTDSVLFFKDISIRWLNQIWTKAVSSRI